MAYSLKKKSSKKIFRKKSRVSKRRMKGGFISKKISTDGSHDVWQLCVNGCCKSRLYKSNEMPPPNLDQLLRSDIERAMENDDDVCFYSKKN